MKTKTGKYISIAKYLMHKMTMIMIYMDVL